MNCANCGAPLPVHSDVCRYCGSLNDIDLGRLQPQNVTAAGLTPHTCPRCEVKLHGMQIAAGGCHWNAIRCPECLGMFFSPPSALDALLQEQIPKLSDVDFERMANFVEESKRDEWPVKYIPCPTCQKFMIRKNYELYSGVIIDWCKDHGIWLDGGELGKLLRWIRSGGHQRAQVRKHETAEEEIRRKEQEKAAFAELFRRFGGRWDRM